MPSELAMSRKTRKLAIFVCLFVVVLLATLLLIWRPAPTEPPLCVGMGYRRSESRDGVRRPSNRRLLKTAGGRASMR